MKKKHLKRLFNLVMRWDDTKDKKHKAALRVQISAANDAFFERWHRDGLALLVLNWKAK